KLNPKWGQPGEPKYMPAITLSPSTLAAYLESCFSSDLARGNLKKLAVDEYGAKPETINEAIEEVGKANGPNEKDVETSVALLKVKKSKTTHPTQLNDVVNLLVNIQTNTVPITVRQTLNELVDAISPQENKGTVSDPKDVKGKPLIKLGNDFYKA